MSAPWIRIRLFSAVSERIGRRELEFPFREGITVGDLRAALAERYPEAQDLWEISAFAVDEAYASDEDPVAPGALVAVIPPVSGG
ncbi:MAG: Molybdenum cofactor biosynthesis protein MoaD [Brockia lithotrophica]|uniref:Molybdopterin synthase sulfur carrier subunit n=1 Tax=Brockia lithotrophica TaxID=933949 RepID=A0A2T5G4J4_9BACL|nr:MoaD/ThiS family protein [Brockia lithotrophica]MBT9253311.1 MoaD/ThiS family protein [Brockia lithotrophica]PTQ51106.1 MAG: Molybdenum cofactor biosynthesis protein MoaD [Brockia lithotrophica]